MKIIISPAKSLDVETKAPTSICTQPIFLEHSEKINKKLKTLSARKLSDLMKISKELAELNYNRNQAWHTPFTLKNAKQTIYTFTGEVYRGINIHTIKKENLSVLQKRLRILSGLYGLLRPLDLILPYRLEMGTRLKIGRKENLYKFWNDILANSLNEELEDNELLINLASSEYIKAIPQKALKTPLISPIFKDFKNGQYKTIMTFAKKARGLMVRYIIDNNINSIEGIKAFNTDNYQFSEELSTKKDLVFTR